MLVVYNWFLWLLCFLIVKRYVTSRTYPCSYLLNNKVYGVFFVIVALFSFFTFFGGDIKNDREMVEGGFRVAAYSDYFSIEKIYVFFAEYSFGILLLWKIYVYGSCILITMWTLKKMNRKDSLTLLFYTLLFLPSMGATRGVLAYSVFLLATYLIVEGNTKEKFLGYPILIGTYLLHTSMVLPILLFFVSKIKLNRFIVILLFFSVPIISVIINKAIMPYLESNPVFMASQMGFKYQQYIYNEDVEFASSFTSRVYNFVTYIYIAICLFYSVTAGWKKKLSKYSRRIVTICFFLAYIGSILSLCDFQNNDVIARRFFSMSLFLIFIAMPELILTRHISQLKTKILIIFGFLRVNWFFAMMLWNEIS